MTAFNLDSFWLAEKQDHIDAVEKTFEALKPAFEQLADACTKAVRQGNKILFFGNGGSAADAQHLATELTVRFINDRKPIPAIALTTDTSALTAIGNDYGFDHLFAREGSRYCCCCGPAARARGAP